MKKTTNTEPRTYAYKIVLNKWHYDYVIKSCMSARISRFILAKSPNEAKKLITTAINKQTKPRGPYWDFISITKVSKKELIRKQRKRLQRIAHQTLAHSLDNLIL